MDLNLWTLKGQGNNGSGFFQKNSNIRFQNGSEPSLNTKMFMIQDITQRLWYHKGPTALGPSSNEGMFTHSLTHNRKAKGRMIKVLKSKNDRDSLQHSPLNTHPNHSGCERWWIYNINSLCHRPSPHTHEVDPDQQPSSYKITYQHH